MVVEFLTPVAGWALGKAADTVWTVATDQVQTKLQRTDIERAIKAGVTAVQAWESSLEVEELLFKSCDDKQKRQFLEQIFADAGVVEQLQRPLASQSEPDIELMQLYFERVANDANIVLTEDSLKPWLQRFCPTYVEKTALFIKFQVARQRYLQQLANWYDAVKFLGISVAGQEDTKSEKLLQIFVMPDVKQRTELPTEKNIVLNSGSGQVLMMFDGLDEVVSDSQAGSAGFLQEARSYMSEQRRKADLMQEQKELASLLNKEDKTFSAVELLKQSRSHRCVLLGAPGSGKTTLMSYFAVALATGKDVEGLGVDDSYLPIVVRIRDWVQSDHTGLLDYIRHFATDKLAVKDLPEGFFEHWLEAGKALILLDGLDEVANEARRDNVVNQIEVFLQGQPYRNNPAIITSRPAGYKQAYFRTEEFPHYDLLPFDQPKIDAFIQNWYDNRFQDKEESQRRQQTLKKALSERDRIQVLAKNPLLLTIIALIHRYEAYLPRDRHQLYNRAVETLLTNWDAGKDIDYTWPLQHLKRDAVRRVMEQLAYWIHSEGSVGDDEGGTLIDREELIEQLGGFIREEANCKRYEAKVDAERFLQFIRSRTGLLNEQGQDRYAFVHKTFQEYLAAEDIRYRQVEDGFEVVQDHINDYLHDSHWEEVLLLLIAQQPKKRVAQIMQQILAHDTLYERWLHRNLFFAADCLAENVKLADTSLIDQILNRLVEFIAIDSFLISSQLQQCAEKCLRNLGETDFQEAALQHLEPQHEKVAPIKLQQIRFALGQEDSAATVLLDRLQNDDSDVRSSAAAALRQLGPGNEAVVQALLDRLQNDDSSIRSRAAATLGQLGQGNEAVVRALLDQLQDDDSDVRSRAVAALGNLGQGNEAVVRALLDRLQDDDGRVRYRAAAALGNLGQGNEAVVRALLNRLQDDDGRVRYRAAAALGNLGSGNEAVVQALLNRLQDDNRSVRSRAAAALGKLGQGNEAVVQALLNRLRDDDSDFRSRAVAALGNLGQGNEAVVRALLDRLQDDDGRVRDGAASALGQLGPGNEAVVQALLERLQSDDNSVRYIAATALGNLGSGSEAVVQALLERLQDDNRGVRYFAAIALGNLGSGSEAVVQALLERLQDDNRGVRSRAAAALGKLGQGSEAVMQALLERLQNDDSSVRYIAATALGNLGSGSEAVVQALLERLQDDDSNVRSRVAYALEQLGQQAADAVAPAISDWIEQHQQSDYVVYGVDALWNIMTDQA